jgi:hypothetical protein
LVGADFAPLPCKRLASAILVTNGVSLLLR